MSFTIQERQVGDVLVLDCVGKIVAGAGAVMLREALRDFINRGYKKVLLNLKEVHFIDSSGLGEMVTGHQYLKNQEGEIGLFNLTERVARLIQISKLYTVFTIYADEAMTVHTAPGSR